ncbi:MAG: phosphatidylglycerophosphatase A [Candidatus Neomarinimicrobiota bacterium]
MSSNRHSVKFSKFIVSLFGVGYFPGFPGTIASLVTAAIAYALYSAFDLHWIWDLEIFLLFMLLGLVVGARLVKHVDIKDPSWFVMDEAAGMWLSMLFLPKDNIWIVLIAFVMFRVFDIWKPWLIRKAEKLPGATGIMMDDVVAAIPSWLITFLIWRFLM